VAGTVGAYQAGPPAVWGGGFGVNLSPLTNATTEVPVQLSGTGITVALTNLPTGAGLEVTVSVETTTYCAVMTAATQTIPWTSFNTICSDPTTDVALTGAPNTPGIGFTVTSGPTVATFDFCVTAISFQ
jgi:hypothetical protein